MAAPMDIVDTKLPDETVVPNSSYVIYEGQSEMGGVPAKSKLVTFYTCDGDAIVTIPHGFRFPVIERKLDKTAPKPRPTAFKRIWWPAIRLGFGMTKGVPGYMVIFYDKNGNAIDFKRIKDQSSDEPYEFYDCRLAKELEPDFSKKEMSKTGCHIM